MQKREAQSTLKWKTFTVVSLLETHFYIGSKRLRDTQSVKSGSKHIRHNNWKGTFWYGMFGFWDLSSDKHKLIVTETNHQPRTSVTLTHYELNNVQWHIQCRKVPTSAPHFQHKSSSISSSWSVIISMSFLLSFFLFTSFCQDVQQQFSHISYY